MDKDPLFCGSNVCLQGLQSNYNRKIVEVKAVFEDPEKNTAISNVRTIVHSKIFSSRS